MARYSVFLAAVLVLGTSPALGGVVADEQDGKGHAGDASTQVPEHVEGIASRLGLAADAVGANPSLEEGFELADEVLAVQQRRAQDASLGGLDATISKQRSHLERVHHTIATVEERTVTVQTSEDTVAPSQAITDLAKQVDAPLTSTQRADVERLDELPEPWPSQLSEWIQAFGSLHARTQAGLADMPARVELLDAADAVERARAQAPEQPGELEPSELTPDYVDVLTDEELTSILNARDRFLHETLEVRGLVESQPLGGQPDVAACPVLAMGLSAEDTTYEEDCRLILDLGGEDTYLNNAGGAWQKQGAPDSCLLVNQINPPDPAPGYRAAALVDLGGQDDAYGDPSDPRGCGVNGGGAFGSGFLLDEGGNDRYVAGGLHSYAQGAANAGTGTLLDLGGEDVYQGARYTNGQAFVGTSLFYDASGNDRYVSTDGWAHGEGGGSQAVLVDAGGRDRYLGANNANGGGVFPGGGVLLDTEGSDVYEAEDTASNGGASFGGSGLLLDLAGNDRYEATSSATNGGGSVGGSGTLVDVRGSEEYLAGSTGANGGGNFGGQGLLYDDQGDDRYEAERGGANGGAGGLDGTGALGLLVDANGTDRYRDEEGGTGVDKSIAPKGDVGAQLDLPHLPEAPSEQPSDEERPTPNPRPHTIVGVGDAPVNPYHDVYSRPNLTEHPCTYIPNFPCDVQALNLSLEVGDLDRALEKDSDVWANVTPGEWYWIPKTAFVAVACEQTAQPPNCIVGPGIGSDPTVHGTGTTSSVLAENPQALIAFHNSDGHSAPIEQAGIPVDVYSISWGNVVPIPGRGGLVCPNANPLPEDGLYVKSAGNTPFTTLADCRNGRPGVITAGGAYPNGRSEEADATKNPDVVSYYCRPTASSASVDEFVQYCGTSFAAPTVAGALSKVILEIRESTGYVGNVTDGMVDPRAGITMAELRDAMNRTASYSPTPRYDDSGGPDDPVLNPFAPWLQWGWGFYDGLVANRTIDHLTGDDPAPPKPVAAQAYMEAQHVTRRALYEEAT